VAALASFLYARKEQGTWRVRIEDIDPPREEPGASAAILTALETHGLHWDGEVRYQSQRLDAYASVIDDLARNGHTFNCTCSRQMLRESQVYPGTCRDQASISAEPTAVRIKTISTDIAFDDLIQGTQRIRLKDDVGDFIIRRKDKLIAYQLAVAVDDLDQGITRIVRGIDLMDSSFKQIYIMQLMGNAPPVYAHIPVITDPQGIKLSKQTHAPALDCSIPGQNLGHALAALGHQAPAELYPADPSSILEWAIDAWRLTGVPPGTSITRTLTT
jgi:glutamyl-Q tRNA(Asp) synthetase